MDIYFKPEYAKLYREIDGESNTYRYECEYGTVQNTFIVRKVKWPINGKQYFDIITPYGYGGPIVLETNNLERLLEKYHKAFSEYCCEHNIVCEFIRFHLFDNVDVREHYYGTTEQILDNVVVNTSGSYDEIWMRYEHKVRKNVKKAKANNLELIIEYGTEHLDDFLGIYYETMDRNSAEKYYYFPKSYFENIEKLLPDNSAYFYVVKEGIAISVELVLCSERYAYSFLGGTNTEYYSYRPNDFLKDGIINWCNKTGKQKFVLGGGYHKDDGIYKYKRTFTHDLDVPFFVGKFIYDKKIYEMLIDERKKETPALDEKSSYFPLYRA